MPKEIQYHPSFLKAFSISGLLLGLGFGFFEQADAAPPAEVRLQGIVRDFQGTHSDFGQDFGIGYGHVAGNVALTQSSRGKPVFSGNGFFVNSQWRNDVSKPIAPHLYASASSAVHLVTAPTLNGNPTFDTYNSLLGPYDSSTNAGPTPLVQTGSTMPTIELPTGLPPLINEANFSGNGSTTLSADIHCEKFRIRNNHTVIISGDVTVLCEEDFRINNYGELIIPDGSSLTVYARGDIEFSNNVDINMSSPDHSRLVIYNLGTEDVRLWNHVSLYAQIISPNAQFHGENNTDFYGTIEAQTIELDNSAGLHLDLPAPMTACGTVLNDLAGISGGAASANVTSSSTFDEWFNDVMGTNLSVKHSITLTLNDNGIYEYINNEFYPIDDRLFGNESAPHNGNFTFETYFSFVYEACGSQFFEVGGADDVYLFIDGRLVIDLGGVMNEQQQIIEFDRLGLTDGVTYQARFFYANRHTYSAELNFRTNVEIIMPAITQITSAAYD
ncbi:MAG: fibro-slime domain-containing protein [Planctomycetes bacterium]|nr:fibro-slime domain-containing protein [Planctomycetota bacterium]